MTRRAIAILSTLLLILAVSAFFGLRSCFRVTEQTAAATASVTSARDSGVADAAINAAAITANSMSMAAEIDAITRENADAIRSAPGGDAAIAAPSSGAGLKALCRRAIYAETARCAAFASGRVKQ